MSDRVTQLVQRGQAVMPGGSSNMGPLIQPGLYLASAEGAYITDVDGARYLDFMSNWTAIIHGHAHPAIVEATIAEARRGIPTTMPSEPELLLAELLCSRVPSFERIKFNNSGMAAGMMAMKAARAFTGRPKIAKFEGVYHGNYDPLEVSFQAAAPTWGDESEPPSLPLNIGTPRALLDDVVVLPFNDEANTERLLRKHASELAAVIVDLAPVRAGAVKASQSFIDMLRRVTTEIGALLVVDEVISFRLGLGGLQASYGLTPDLTMLGKIIGGGALPVGAVAGRADVMSVFQGKVPMFGTFSANTMTMAAGHAAMKLLTQKVIDDLSALGDRARAGIAHAFAKTGVDGQVTGQGSLVSFVLHQRRLPSYRNARPATPAEANEMHDLLVHLRENGIIWGMVGGALNAAMTTNDIDLFVDALTRGLEKLRGKRV